jgi:hypothetical protein
VAVMRRTSVRLTRAELVEVEWSLRQRLDAWDDDDEDARVATKVAHEKVVAALGRVDRAR